MQNPNTDYELFTREVYQQLVDLDVIRNTHVEHNKTLEGRSGQKHQIDVYWEYEIAGNKHRVAIECKNYKTTVPIAKVRDFKGVLDDLNGVNGIMVTKNGYQEGAKRYAQEYGISLMELRAPRYGETIIGEYTNNFYIESRYTVFWVDEDWAEKKGFSLDNYRKRLSLLFGSRNELWDTPPFVYIEWNDGVLRDSAGTIITTLQQLESQIPDHPTNDFPFVFNYNDAYLDSRLGYVKILAVKYDFIIRDRKKIIALDAGGFVKAILKNSQNGNTDFFVLR